MGVFLPCPFSDHASVTMLDKIKNNVLDHSLLDANGIMEKYSSFLL